MKILIVDDERFNLIVAEEIVKSFNLFDEVIHCNDPFKVVDLIIKDSIDVVLLDIMMPEKSGLEVLTEIRSINLLKDVQVIMLTALSDQEYFTKCFEIGADDYVGKPIDAVTLRARLSAAIKTRSNAELLKEMFFRLRNQNTELKNLNKTIKEAQDQVIQNEKLASIGSLAAGVAHEINNPMGFINSNMESLENYTKKIMNVFTAYKGLFDRVANGEDLTKMEDLPTVISSVHEIERKNKISIVLKEMEGLFSDTRSGIDRVTKIITTLRNFARTGTDEEMSYQSIDQIIEEALLILKNEIKYSIRLEKDYGEVDQVFLNKGLIEQVALNIVINSIQSIKNSNPDEKGVIEIRTYRENGWACFSISDDGGGLPEEEMHKVFDPFFTTKEVGVGTGLGLSISQDIIVNKHKGTITLTNRKDGRGASCIVRIPKLDEMEMEYEENFDRR